MISIVMQHAHLDLQGQLTGILAFILARRSGIRVNPTHLVDVGTAKTVVLSVTVTVLCQTGF